jgi:hypothetical protein
MNNRMTAADFRKKYAPTNPGNQVINQTKNEANSHTPVSNTSTKRHEAKQPLGSKQGKVSGFRMPHVRFLLRRVRLLDVDAKYASVKDLLDGLQIAGCISGDKEGQITLQVDQEKVGSYVEEKTVIEIDDPNRLG